MKLITSDLRICNLLSVQTEMYLFLHIISCSYLGQTVFRSTALQPSSPTCHNFLFMTYKLENVCLWKLSILKQCVYSFWTDFVSIINLILHPEGGRHLYFRLVITIVKGLSKHTLNTYFSGTKKDLKFAFLHAFPNLSVTMGSFHVNSPNALNLTSFKFAHIWFAG